MGFLIRSAFWFSLVLLMLPFGGGDQGNQVGPLQALMAARAAVDDFSGICERRPDVCETGKAALHTIGIRAKAGARYAYEMLDEDGDQAGADAPDATADTADATGRADTTLKTGTIAPAIPTARPKKD
jgi:hypothetical protein